MYIVVMSQKMIKICDNFVKDWIIMLIRYIISNFLSFSEPTEFSMFPGKGLLNSDDQIMKFPNAINLLKGGLIYGANASGKSNFIKSLEFAKSMITNFEQKDEKLSDVRFKLNENMASTPTKFEFEFISNGIPYAYGFSFTSEKIEEEWLYRISKTKDTMIFLRENNTFTLNKRIIKNQSEFDRLKFMYDDLFPTQLFLTSANSRNISNLEFAADLINAFDWFNNKLIIIFPQSKYFNWQAIDEDEKLRLFMKESLYYFDTGINDIKFEERDINEIKNEIPKDVFTDIIKNIKKMKKIMVTEQFQNNIYIFFEDKHGIKVKELVTSHTANNSSVTFKIGNESDGTKRLTDFLPLLLKINQKEHVIVIDEIDRSMHTELSRKLIDLLLHKTQGHQFQLIASTHDTALLDLNLIRKDEIWFVEKEKKR